MLNTMIVPRPYDKGDREGIFHVCHKTGFFGEDASPQFKDAELFGLIFTSYYIDFEPESAFVAQEAKKIVGYIIGTDDTATQREYFDRLVIPKIVKRIFGHTLFHHPKDFFFILRLKGISKYEEEIYTPDFIERYPAHLHINLLPGYQGKGLGTKLMTIFEKTMRGLDVRGIHLITSTENRKAVPFYRKMGYEVIKELPDILWDRKSPPGTKSLVFGKML